MEFRVLGPVEVLDDGRAIPIGGPKQRAVLAHLILQPNRIVPAEASRRRAGSGNECEDLGVHFWWSLDVQEVPRSLDDLHP